MSKTQLAAAIMLMRKLLPLVREVDQKKLLTPIIEEETDAAPYSAKVYKKVICKAHSRLKKMSIDDRHHSSKKVHIQSSILLPKALKEIRLMKINKMLARWKL